MPVPDPMTQPDNGESCPHAPIARRFARQAPQYEMEQLARDLHSTGQRVADLSSYLKYLGVPSSFVGDFILACPECTAAIAEVFQDCVGKIDVAVLIEQDRARRPRMKS